MYSQAESPSFFSVVYGYKYRLTSNTTPDPVRESVREEVTLMLRVRHMNMGPQFTVPSANGTFKDGSLSCYVINVSLCALSNIRADHKMACKRHKGIELLG